MEIVMNYCDVRNCSRSSVGKDDVEVLETFSDTPSPSFQKV